MTYTCPACGYNGTLSGVESKEGHRMPETRNVAQLLAEAAKASTPEQRDELVARAELLKKHARDAVQSPDIDLARAIIEDRLTPVRVHEHHTAATNWIAEMPTAMDTQKVAHEMTAQASVWFDRLPEVVKSYPDEFAEQARGAARHLAGAFGEQADLAEDTFLRTASSLHEQAVHAGQVTLASAPQVGEQGMPTATMPAGMNTDGWLPGDVTSSNRAPQMGELAQNATSTGATDVTPVNDPGLGQSYNTADVANGDVGTRRVHPTAKPGLDSLGAQHTAVSEEDLQVFPKCAKCGQPVTAVEMRRNGNNEPEHGVCPTRNQSSNLVTSSKEGNTMTGAAAHDQAVQQGAQHTATATCPTCGIGAVAVRQQQPMGIGEAMRRLAVSGLDQIDQVVDPHDNGPKPTPLPQQVAWPLEEDPQGQVQQNVQQAEQQIAEREQRKGAARKARVEELARTAAQNAYNATRNQGMAQLDPSGTFDPQRKHARLHALAVQAGNRAYALVKKRAGQDDSGWAGDMGAGGVGPGQQDGGNPMPPSNLGEPDPVYGYGGDQGDRPLKPYGADEADDETNNPGMWAPGQPTQYDLGGRQESTGAGGPGDAPGFPNPPITTPPNNGRKASRQQIEAVRANMNASLQGIRQQREWLQAQGLQV